jgi:hypothetical protein
MDPQKGWRGELPVVSSERSLPQAVTLRCKCCVLLACFILQTVAAITKLEAAARMQVGVDGSATDVAWELRRALDYTVKHGLGDEGRAAGRGQQKADESVAKKKETARIKDAARVEAGSRGLADEEMPAGTRVTIAGYSQPGVYKEFRRKSFGPNEHLFEFPPVRHHHTLILWTDCVELALMDESTMRRLCSGPAPRAGRRPSATSPS